MAAMSLGPSSTARPTHAGVAHFTQRRFFPGGKIAAWVFATAAIYRRAVQSFLMEKSRFIKRSPFIRTWREIGKELSAGVRGITPNSHNRAGVKAGDRIIGFNNEVIDNGTVSSPSSADVPNDIPVIMVAAAMAKTSKPASAPAIAGKFLIWRISSPSRNWLRPRKRSG